MYEGYEHEKEWERLGHDLVTSYGRGIEQYTFLYPGNPRQDRETTNVNFPSHAEALNQRANIYLASRSLSWDLAQKAGWYAAEYNGPRIIVPCVRTNGTFWQGRLIEDDELRGDYKRWDSPHGPRGDAVCYLDINPEGPLFLVEGPMDALAIADNGYSSLASLGATPSGEVCEHIASILSRRKIRYGVAVPDRDQSAFWLKLCLRLLGLGALFFLEYLPSGYKDFAEVRDNERAQVLGEIIEKIEGDYFG